MYLNRGTDDGIGQVVQRCGHRVALCKSRRTGRSGVFLADRSVWREPVEVFASAIFANSAFKSDQQRGAIVIRPILKYGDSILVEPARRVEAVTPDIQRLIDDMIETMYAAPGVGLAAPQVGVPLRIFVIDLSLGREPAGLIVMVNPEFVSREGMQLEEEGCLSVPGFNATVVRPLRAVVKGLNRDGQEEVRDGKELLARAFQHEMDHLDGRLFIDHLRGIKRDMIVRRIRKLTRAGKW
jgi:peptide deformylase